MTSLTTDQQATHKYDALEVIVCKDYDHLGQVAANRAGGIILDAINLQGGARIILATGNSMLGFLSNLRRLTRIDWRRVEIFHMDEYLGMAVDHPASFRRYMHEKIVDIVNPRAFYEMIGDAQNVESECIRYEALLKEQPIDLCCLGIGENGHLAFNDPPVADFNDPRWVKVVELDTPCRMQQVGEGHFPSLAATPTHAVTLTIPALLAAKQVLGIVPERRKAQAVKNALTGPISTACPASILRKTAHACVLLDHESASLL